MHIFLENFYFFPLLSTKLIIDMYFIDNNLSTRQK